MNDTSHRLIQRLANSCARRNGYGKATAIRFEDFTVVESTPFGYRKKTTGQYVPRAYRSRFGWKNTYYQNAVCVVAAPLRYQLLP